MIYIILYTDALAGDSQFSAGETAGVFVIFHDSHGKEGGRTEAGRVEKGAKRVHFQPRKGICKHSGERCKN